MPTDHGAIRPADAQRSNVGDALAVAGFACLLATMLLYSAAAMPFQRFDTLPSFVGVFSYELRTAAAFGLAVAALSCLRGVRTLLGARATMVAGTLPYLAGNALFCLMALGAVAPGAAPAAGVLIGIGCVMQTLAWGRVLARYTLKHAVAVVAASAVIAALIGWAQLALPERGAVAVFMACSAVCAALPFALGGMRRKGRGSTGEAIGDAGGQRRGLRGGVALVGTFLDVALVPSVGLLLFAMLMGMRGELFFEDYPQYVAIQVVVAALLFVIVLLPTRRPLLQAIYRGLVPTLAVAVLAVNYVSEALFGGSSFEIALVMLLYTAAALLCLSTLIGMAHAAEFSADLISSLAVGAFSLATVLTQHAGSAVGLDAEGTRAVVVVTSGAYAAGMIAFTIWRGLGSVDAAQPQVPARGPSDLLGATGTDEGRTPADGLAALAPTLDERCDELARRYALTAREREILGYLAQGHTGSYIGDELLISPNTVRTHIHNIYQKFGVATRDDILRLVRNG